MNGYTVGDFTEGHRVFAFHPHTLGVCHWATITKVGRKWLTVEWHVTGKAGRVLPRDVVRREGVHYRG